LGKTGRPKQGDIMACAAILGEVGEDFPTTLQNLKPWPEKPPAMKTLG
jgi:hypothetical protein